MNKRRIRDNREPQELSTVEGQMERNPRSCDCRDGHKDQLVNFPVGVRVLAVCDIGCGEDWRYIPIVPRETPGSVRGHCDNGRAIIEFAGHLATHTFHFPNEQIERAP